MQTPTWLPSVLRFDAALNAAGMVILALLGGRIADVLGLEQAWPLYVVAALLAVNGIEVAMAARDPRPGLLLLLAVFDFAFVAAVVAFAATGDGIESWARIALYVIAAATVVTGEAKLLGRKGLVATA
jgi:hypothetical protein